jgi:HEAT repeat protein
LSRAAFNNSASVGTDRPYNFLILENSGNSICQDYYVTRPPVVNEIRQLVESLGSRSRRRVDAARARLLIIGARAVEDLVEALEGHNNAIKASVIPLLALIQDPRGREPLIAMLLDRKIRLRESAARSLARFPSPDTVAALNRSLKRERSAAVRLVVVHSLIAQYSAGQDAAVRLVLELLLDSTESGTLRCAAMSLLHALRCCQRRSILDRLVQDDDRAVSERACELIRAQDGPDGLDHSRIQTLVDDLASDDYAIWNEAIEQLAACGPAALGPLIEGMQGRADDPEYCIRAGMALRTLGPRRARALADSLAVLEDPLPLQVLVEALGAIGEKSQIYRLTALIERLSRTHRQPGRDDGFDLLRRVWATAHLELAWIGSRVAIENLRDGLLDPGQRIELEALAALERIGKREDIEILLLAYLREDKFTRNRIAQSVLAIMKRERIRRNSRIFFNLGRESRRALAEILPPPGRPRSRNARSQHLEAL